ncbi:Secreted protein containing C-terminal beta-propeller domain [Streptosporangium subroseum]|uniref:Secreted protein containing C-terminal beta-propeller domain n=1 Tax=Streptosporangium subroseum TaxID=106412 RepID=A0A239JAF8_9ACTN|nr:beta-propeller domain-containing protein [Streptosporangium subroseum]SNT02996.1 Secreted protein containing C-terminal beta-propeller domain [Streptosporangium subroseum]
MRTSIRTAGAVTLAAALLATACSSTEPRTGPSAEARTGASRTTPVDLGNIKLVSYSGCDDMLAGLRTETAKNVGPWGIGGPMTMLYADARPAMRSDATAAKGASGAPEHSTTNVHEAGVDEPDLVKTDGNRVITVNRGVLRVVDAATRKVTGTLRLVDTEQAWAPADLLISGDRALVLFSGGGIIPFGAMAKRPASSGPRYVLVDLSGAPKVIGSLTPNGAHVDARMVGSTVRIVVRSQPEINFPDAGPDLSENERTRRNMDVVAKTPIEAWLPTFEVTAADGTTSKKSVGCEQISHPAEYTGTSMLTVHSLDLSPGVTEIAETAPIGVAADGDTVYGTGGSLYVTSNPRWWWPRPINPPIIDDSAPPAPTETATATELPKATPAAPAAPQSESTPSEPPVPVNPTPAPALAQTPAVPPASEPTPPSVPTLTKAPPTPVPPKTPVEPPEETEVHRFDITAPGAPRYVASGKVPGRLLNQYSLSEHEGYLRVATTSTAGQSSSSAVYVLKADTLGKVGEVGGLGAGERIYSVRFIGPVGYVVTFRQVDPLYTLDLRDPAAPRKTGELKITGYSAYLHPAGEGRLIGVGQEASEKGRTLGTQVSLFDVSDPANPRRLSQMFQKDSGSEAEWDPHAFLYWAKTGMAVLPLSTWTGAEQTNGAALVLKIDDSAVTRTGTVVHPKPKPAPGADFVTYDPGIRRSIVIGDSLWTVSDLGLKVSDMNGLADQAWIPFS